MSKPTNIQNGQKIRVNRFQCVTRGDSWPPERIPESYEATVTFISAGGMVYSKTKDGVEKVCHADEVTR